MEKIYRVQMNKNGMPNFSTAEEVVTCGECKFCANRTDGRIECRLWEHPLRIQYSEMKLDDFCSYGEREGE